MRQIHKSTKTRVNFSADENVDAVIDIFVHQWIIKQVHANHPEIIKKAEELKQKLIRDLNCET